MKLITIVCLFAATIGHASWEEFFPNGLTNAAGEEISPAELNDKDFVCLYFSAEWCGPCKGFTPRLLDFYEEYGDHVEVVLVSKDRSAEAFFQYLNEYSMPWFAVKWQDYRASDENEPLRLIRKYRAGGIPRLVVLDSEGKVVVDNARMEIQNLPEFFAEYYAELDSDSAVRRHIAYQKRKGRELSEEDIAAYRERIDQSYVARAADYQQRFEESQRKVTLGEKPSWNDLVDAYYQQLRAEQGTGTGQP